MTAKKSKAPRQQGVVIHTAANEEEALARHAAARAMQNQHARDYADSIERGELPEAPLAREFIAVILRSWADRPPPPKPAKRGNPSFKRKIYSPDRVALEVVIRIADGEDPHAAKARVADLLEVDESTVAKILRDRREAVERFIGINVASRGAIRGE
jgi:hypothetical protein